jgi:hypothetical protein
LFNISIRRTGGNMENVAGRARSMKAAGLFSLFAVVFDVLRQKAAGGRGQPLVTLLHCNYLSDWSFPMAGPARNAHGSTVRGLNLPRGSKFFGGQFGRMFRSLPPADFGASDSETEVNLLKHGKAMVAGHDGAKDGPDAEESGIPSAYTYLGQFIDHDLTFDPASSLQ